MIPPGTPLDSVGRRRYTHGDFNNCSQYHKVAFMITGPFAETSETRCECGQLIAKVKGQSLELKCKRCKRIVVIPFSSIHHQVAYEKGGFRKYRRNTALLKSNDQRPSSPESDHYHLPYGGLE